MLLAQTSVFGYYIGYYGITGVIPCPGEHYKARMVSRVVIMLGYTDKGKVVGKTVLSWGLVKASILPHFWLSS
jgi:hypothetical protein